MSNHIHTETSVSTHRRVKSCTLGNMTWIIQDGDTLDTVAQRRQFTRERMDQLTAELILFVRDEAAKGTTEVELAKRAGVTRQTIRNWLGK